MDLVTVLERVAASREDTDAWAALRPALNRLAFAVKDRDRGVVGRFLEQAVDDVEFKILSLALGGQAPWADAPVHYVRRMLVNRSISLSRSHLIRERAHRGIQAKSEASVAEAAASGSSLAEPMIAEELAILDATFRAALARRQERHRPDLVDAWERATAKFTEGLTFPELVARIEGASLDHDELTRHVSRYQKAQQRLRKAMLDVLDAQRTEGVLSDLDATVARDAVTRWIDCPQSRRERVPEGEDSP